MFKVILSVNFFDKQRNCHAGFARLEVELPFAPTADIAFEHSVWHNPRKPEDVSFNLEAGEFFVNLGLDSLQSTEEVIRYAEMYKGHEWEVTAVLPPT
jgi:hypothetical protein